MTVTGQLYRLKSSNNYVQILLCLAVTFYLKYFSVCCAIQRELLEKTCQVANALKRDGVKKGDRVAIYMPVSPLLVASMLACARIGAVHR